MSAGSGSESQTKIMKELNNRIAEIRKKPQSRIASRSPNKSVTGGFGVSSRLGTSIDKNNSIGIPTHKHT